MSSETCRAVCRNIIKLYIITSCWTDIDIDSCSLTDLPFCFCSKMFVNPETGEFFQYGDRVRLKELCETLKMIALHGGDYLYNGTLAKTFVSDIQQMGGIITEEDMANYRYMVTN